MKVEEVRENSDSIVLAPQQPSKLKTSVALAAMTIGCFSFGVNEFLMAGLLPNIESTFDVSVSKAGWVTTSFMIGLAVSAPTVTVLTVNAPRKYVLMGLLSLLMGASVMTAASPNFNTLMVARALSACGHASYMGVGSYVASQLVPKEYQVRASAVFFSGLTLALAVGVPLGTLLADKANWRLLYWIVVGLAGASLLGVTFLVPSNIEIPVSNIKKALGIYRHGPVWMAIGATAFGYSGMLASHTYFSNMMIDLAGYKKSDLSWLTCVYGVGTALGNLTGGRLADWNLNKAICGLMLSLASVLTGFYWAADYKVFATIALFLNGFTGFSLVAPLMQYIAAKAGADEKIMASATGISAFGAGIGLGVYLSGLAISKNQGYSSPNWVGASLTMFGLLFVVLNECCCSSVSLTANIKPSAGATGQAVRKSSKELSLLFNSDRRNSYDEDALVHVAGRGDETGNAQTPRVG